MKDRNASVRWVAACLVGAAGCAGGVGVALMSRASLPERVGPTAAFVTSVSYGMDDAVQAHRFDAASTARGARLFDGKADCATCHVPEAMSLDVFHGGVAVRADDGTLPLRGLWTQGGDRSTDEGRVRIHEQIADRHDVLFAGLTDSERVDLIEFLTCQSSGTFDSATGQESARVPVWRDCG